MRNGGLPYRESRRGSTEQDALLTQSLRKFLEGDGTGYSDSQASKKNTDISNRLYNSLLDIALLYRNRGRDRLDFSDDVFQPKLFERDDTNGDLPDYRRRVRQPTAALEELIALVYLETVNQPQPADFETIIENGIRKAEDDRSVRDRFIEVNIEIEEAFGSTPILHTQEKIIDGEWKDMTEGELRLFAKSLSDADRETREEAADMVTLESLTMPSGEDWD